MLPITTVIWRLLWAALLGAVVGTERSLRRRPAGMRTSLCVSVGAALFTIASFEIAHATGDSSSTRIASNIVQGVGFLGAGVILRDRGSVTGLTTAATIFGVAALGMTAGGGFYAISGIACAIVLTALIGLVYVENIFKLKPRYMFFRITTDDATDLVPEIHRMFADRRIVLDNFQVSMEDSRRVIQFDADVDNKQQAAVLSALSRQGIVTEMLPGEREHE
jgi:putative Mg2+ transporter-C (MgtC) family protein